MQKGSTQAIDGKKRRRMACGSNDTTERESNRPACQSKSMTGKPCSNIPFHDAKFAEPANANSQCCVSATTGGIESVDKEARCEYQVDSLYHLPQKKPREVHLDVVKSVDDIIPFLGEDYDEYPIIELETPMPESRRRGGRQISLSLFSPFRKE